MKSLNVIDRQWASISVLTQLAGIGAIDLGLGNSASPSFQNFLGMGLCSSELERALAACRARNARDLDVYMRPARGSEASVVMIDDLSLALCLQIANGKAHMIVETSPSNYQLWLRTDRLLTEAERKAAQIALVAQHGGDPGSVSGEHYGRLPGFRNRKPKYRDRAPWVNLIQYSLDDAPLAVAGLLNAGGAAGAGASSRPPGGGCALEPAAGGAGAVPVRSSGSSDSAESHKEFKFAVESLRKNVKTEIVIAKIAQRALARGKRKTLAAAEAYARKTVGVAALRI